MKPIATSISLAVCATLALMHLDAMAADTVTFTGGEVRYVLEDLAPDDGIAAALTWTQASADATIDTLAYIPGDAGFPGLGPTPKKISGIGQHAEGAPATIDLGTPGANIRFDGRLGTAQIVLPTITDRFELAGFNAQLVTSSGFTLTPHTRVTLSIDLSIALHNDAPTRVGANELYAEAFLNGDEGGLQAFVPQHPREPYRPDVQATHTFTQTLRNDGDLSQDFSVGYQTRLMASAPVPEAAAMAYAVSGLAALGLAGWRRRRAPSRIG